MPWHEFNSNDHSPLDWFVSMAVQVEGFVFNDYCHECQKTTEHGILLEGKQLFGACSSCGQKRTLTEVKQVHYPQTDLWVTRFKIGNLPSVVTGKLLDTIRHTKQS
jgi:hypothetical protein